MSTSNPIDPDPSPAPSPLLDARTPRPGDEVAVVYPEFDHNDYASATVRTVWADGSFDLSYGDTYRPDGKKMVWRSDEYFRPYVVEVTGEIREEMRLAAPVEKVRERLADWRSLPTPTLERLAAALEPLEGEETK